MGCLPLTYWAASKWWVGERKLYKEISGEEEEEQEQEMHIAINHRRYQKKKRWLAADILLFTIFSRLVFALSSDRAERGWRSTYRGCSSKEKLISADVSQSREDISWLVTCIEKNSGKLSNMLIQQLAWVSSLSSHTQGAAPLSTSSGGPDCQRSKALENDVAGKQCEKIGGKKKKKKSFF